MLNDWDKLRIFSTVAGRGSFTAASEDLKLSQSAISRQISALEDNLGLILFHRHARGLALTEQGEILYKTVREVSRKLSMVQKHMLDVKERPEGPLKISTTVAFGSTWLTARIKDFIDHYPGMQVSLFLTDQEVDLSMRQADVAIRMTQPTQGDLIQRPLMAVRSFAYASREYLAAHGAPRSAADLDGHRLIIYGEDDRHAVSTINWLLHAGEEAHRPRRPVLTVNNFYGTYRAVRSGLGIGALASFMAPDIADLVRVLPELEGPPHQAWFVYPEELRHSRRIVVFRDFLLHAVAEASWP